MKDMFLVNHIKEKRLEKGFSQDYVAEMLGKTRSWYCKLETSNDASLVLRHIERIAEILDIESEKLYSMSASQVNNNNNQQGGIGGVTNSTLNLTVQQELIDTTITLLRKLIELLEEKGR